VTLRVQLQEQIIAHGGAYRGCLTSDVTHLIANAPEGRKYQCAKEWDIQVVSLRWFKGCIERGMVLEESLYRPTIPLKGASAWNRDKAKVLGKRRRDPDPVRDPGYRQINKKSQQERIRDLEQQVPQLNNALQRIENMLRAQVADTTVSYTYRAPFHGTSLCSPLASQHPPVTHSRTSMRIKAMTTSSLIESRRSEAKATIDASDEDRTISGDTSERILAPDLKGDRRPNRFSRYAHSDIW
jgi:hypothetical protein